MTPVCKIHNLLRSLGMIMCFMTPAMACAAEPEMRLECKVVGINVVTQEKISGPHSLNLWLSGAVYRASNGIDKIDQIEPLVVDDPDKVLNWPNVSASIEKDLPNRIIIATEPFGEEKKKKTLRLDLKKIENSESKFGFSSFVQGHPFSLVEDKSGLGGICNLISKDKPSSAETSK
jgi:hypothetical protein